MNVRNGPAPIIDGNFPIDMDLEELQISEAAAADEGMELESGKNQEAPRQYRILIAEDNKLMRRIVEKRVIEAAKDMPMVFDMAWDGNEAIEKARTTKYHLIFMDFRMPNCEGNEAVRAIREFDSETPIFLQSDTAQDELNEAFDGLSINGSLNGKLTKLAQVVDTLAKLEIFVQ